MQILVVSCDKNADLYDPFCVCMEKYWPGHPCIFYSCETIENVHYNSILKNYPTEQWTKRVKESLEQMTDDKVILMCDDCFIRRPVNKELVEKLSEYVKDNVAFINFEKSFDTNDTTIDENVLKRPADGKYKISVMCGIWDRKKLIDLLDWDADPWTFERTQKCKDYDYLINKDKLVIDFGHYKSGDLWGLWRGKWMRELEVFFNSEGIIPDYSVREFYD